MFISILAFAVSAKSQSAVTLTERARPMAEVLADLSKRTGHKFKVDAALVADTMVLEVKDVPLNVLTQKLAEVSAGKWIVKDGAEVLVRDREVWKKWNAEERAERIALIKKAFPEMRGKAQEPFDESAPADLAAARSQSLREMGFAFERDDQGMLHKANSTSNQTLGGKGYEEFQRRVERDNRMLPGSRAARRMLAAIGADQIADLPLNERVVFSPDPTPVQRRLPGDAQSLLGTLNSEFLAWRHGIMTPTGHEDPKIATIDSPSISIGNLDCVNDFTQYDHGWRATSLFLSLKRTRWWIQAELTANGTQPGEPVSGSDGITLLAYAPPSDFGLDSTEQVYLNPESDEVRKALRGRADARISPGLRSQLMATDRYDPLSWINAAWLIGLNRVAGSQLVADLPDSDLNECWLLQNKAPAKVLAAEIAKDPLIRSSLKDGWLLVRPVATSDLESHADRARLRQCLEQLGHDADRSTEALSRYFNERGREDEDVLPTYFKLLFPTGDFSNLKWRVLQLNGTLTKEQRGRLEGVEGLEVGTLPNDQQGILSEMLYNGDFDNREDGPPVWTGSRPFSEEPTIAFPTGLPASITLRALIKSESGISVKSDGGAQGLVYSIGEFASSMRDFHGPSDQLPPNYRPCAAGTKVSLNFTLDLGEPGYMFVLSSVFAPSDPEFTRFNRLPVTIRNSVQAALDAQRGLGP